MCFGDQTNRILFLCVLRTTFKVSDPILNNMPPLPNTEVKAISRGCLAASTLSTLHFLRPKFPVKDKMLRYGKWVHQTGSSASLGHLTHRFKKKSHSSTPVPTRGQTDAVAVPAQLQQSALLEVAFPLFYAGFLLVHLMDDDVQLSLHNVDLPLGQLLLSPPQLLLLLPLLLGGPSQSFLPRSQLLRRR